MIVRLKKTTTTQAGIILQSDHDGNVDEAKVVATGPEVTEVRIGDRIFIDWNKAAPVSIDNVPHYVISEDSIVWVFE